MRRKEIFFPPLFGAVMKINDINHSGFLIVFYHFHADHMLIVI